MISLDEPLQLMQTSTPSLVVVPPEPQDMSFGWGDFPVVSSTTPITDTPTPAPTYAPTQPSCSKKRALTAPSPPPGPFAFDISEVSSSSEEEEEYETDDCSMMDVSSVVSLTTETRIKKKHQHNRGALSVQFSTVQVREHAVILGDHPWAEDYPISLDWKHTSVSEYPVEDFEAHHRRQHIQHCTADDDIAPPAFMTHLQQPRPRKNMPRRLSVVERKTLIITLGETTCTMEQLEDMEAQRKVEMGVHMHVVHLSNDPVEMNRQLHMQQQQASLQKTSTIHLSRSMLFEPPFVYPTGLAIR